MKLTYVFLRTMIMLLLFSWVSPELSSSVNAAGTPQPAEDSSSQPGTRSTGGGGMCFPYLTSNSDNATTTADTYITPNTAPSLPLSRSTQAPLPVNTSYETAIELTPGVPIEGYLPPDDQDCVWFQDALYYKITVTKTQKITALMLVPPGLDYSMYLEGTASFRHKGPYDQLSYVAQPGTYYLRVSEGHTRGSLTQPFNLRVMLSDKFDDYERYSDDSSATDAYYRGTSVQTIDNLYDEDWKMFGIDYPGTTTVRLDNPSAKGVYKVEIWDWADNVIATVKQNETKTLRLPVTSYFVRVYAPSKYDPDVPYTLTMDTKYDPQPVCDWDEEEPWKWVCTGP
ncbi:hypothetical protein [Paenibacillus bovis]|uniref:Peptidase C-terminal archaeal/bacterial domain-containing protein n=1 Tax=Paenibacillus bovis TaxID=1616788 RepID=A0A172ZI46_9BACL|nr:hypothetical protein [Paenibacillus bovis]ANF97311.1 hypothetical protein AR543_15755 [Paenibacillus bovis]